MPRPTRCRRICSYPDHWGFEPLEATADQPIVLTLDEFETLRLIDYQGLTQEECAAKMDVSRATVTGIYGSARHKLADALVNGKRLRITGGTYRIDEMPESRVLNKKNGGAMRIAVTYDQEMVGQHFGRTKQFKLYDVTDGAITEAQILDTNGKGHGALAGLLKQAEVDALICGGIGMGARIALDEAGIQLYPGVSGSADEAAAALFAGTLGYNPDESCDHHGHGEGHGCHDHGDGHDCHHGHGHDHGHGCGEHGCHE